MAVGRAVIVVDIQRDFCEGGALAAPDTMSLVIQVASFINLARENRVAVAFTQDWHPPNHSSFLVNGGRYPVHCQANTPGATLMPPLAATRADIIIKKGSHVHEEGYSAFESTGLSERFFAKGINEVAVCGIATEYCVRATALDAVKAGFRTTVLTDLIRALNPESSKSVLDELQHSGVSLLESQVWLER
jgi:nicotinamidase/pyrazinamidase